MSPNGLCVAAIALRIAEVRQNQASRLAKLNACEEALACELKQAWPADLDFGKHDGEQMVSALSPEGSGMK